MSVDLSVENGLAEIVLNRPDKMNALNDAMVAELNGASSARRRLARARMLIRAKGRRSRPDGISPTRIRGTKTPKR